jgi:uncharacterized protein (DUF58 family)
MRAIIKAIREASRTRSPLKYRDNCGSGFTIIILGALATTTAFIHPSALSAAFGLTLVLVPTLVWVLLRISVRGLRLTRQVPDSVFENDTVVVRVALRNRSRLPLFFPELHEVFSPELHTQKNVLFPSRIMPGETIEGSYEGQCLLPRGEYTLGPTGASLSDPFGWFRLRVSLGNRRKIKVYPAFEAFGILNHSLSSGATPLFEETRFGIGESNDFFSVRDYRHGDPLRRIHWPLTAHRSFPVVREYVRASTGDLLIYLDLYRYALLGVGRASSLEHAVRITAAIAADALGRGHRVQIHGKGKAECRASANSGKEQLQAILDALVYVRPNGGTRYEELLATTRFEVESGSTVILMVSPYLYESTRFAGQIKDLDRNGCRVILVVFDDTSFRSIYEPPSGEITGARLFASRYRAQGIEVFTVPCAADLKAVFQAPPGVFP